MGAECSGQNRVSALWLLIAVLSAPTFERELMRQRITAFTCNVAITGTLAIALPVLGAGFNSPYEPIAALEGGVVLVETERARLENELILMLKEAGRQKYADLYAGLPKNSKLKVAKSYSEIQKSIADAKKVLAATSMIIEVEEGLKNAKVFIEEWQSNQKVSGVETYTVAPKVRSVAKFAPGILGWYDLAQLQEIDRLQKQTFDAIIAQTENEIAQNRQEIAQTDQRIAKLKNDIERLQKLLLMHQ